MDGLTLRAEDLGLSDEVLERIKAGECVDIIKNGERVASLGMPLPIPESAFRAALVEDILGSIKRLRADGITYTLDELRAMRDDHGSDD